MNPSVALICATVLLVTGVLSYTGALRSPATAIYFERLAGLVVFVVGLTLGVWTVLR